jgi:hypothetical protein
MPRTVIAGFHAMEEALKSGTAVSRGASVF